MRSLEQSSASGEGVGVGYTVAEESDVITCEDIVGENGGLIEALAMATEELRITVGVGTSEGLALCTITVEGIGVASVEDSVSAELLAGVAGTMLLRSGAKVADTSVSPPLLAVPPVLCPSSDGCWLSEDFKSRPRVTLIRRPITSTTAKQITIAKRMFLRFHFRLGMADPTT